jgi:hypothetical protein
MVVFRVLSQNDGEDGLGLTMKDAGYIPSMRMRVSKKACLARLRRG